MTKPTDKQIGFMQNLAKRNNLAMPIIESMDMAQAKSWIAQTLEDEARQGGKPAPAVKETFPVEKPYAKAAIAIDKQADIQKGVAMRFAIDLVIAGKIEMDAIKDTAADMLQVMRVL